MNRVCKKCGEEKPIEEFVKNKCSPRGYTFECKQCKNKRNRSYCGNNRQYNKEWQKKYREKHKEYYKDLQLKSNIERTDKLTDTYIVQNIHYAYGLDYKTIRQHPELIESYRQQIKIKRLLKQKKDENIKTS
jgi:hypothetical protein